MKYLSICSMLLILSGCATVPQNAQKYSQAPMAKEGSGVLYIYRNGAYPLLRTPSIEVDGENVFDPPEGAYTWIHLPQGEHELEVNWAWDTGWPDLKFIVPIEAGKEHYLRISGSSDHHGEVHHMGSKADYVSKPEAEEELSSCCRYMPPNSNG